MMHRYLPPALELSSERDIISLSARMHSFRQVLSVALLNVRNVHRIFWWSWWAHFNVFFLLRTLTTANQLRPYPDPDFEG